MKKKVRVYKKGGGYQQGGPAPAQDNPEEMMQQLVQMITQMLSQGIEVPQIIEQLTQQGIPEEEALQLVQQVAEENQGFQSAPQSAENDMSIMVEQMSPKMVIMQDGGDIKDKNFKENYYLQAGIDKNSPYYNKHITVKPEGTYLNPDTGEYNTEPIVTKKHFFKNVFNPNASPREKVRYQFEQGGGYNKPGNKTTKFKKSKEPTGFDPFQTQDSKIDPDYGKKKTNNFMQWLASNSEEAMKKKILEERKQFEKQYQQGGGYPYGQAIIPKQDMTPFDDPEGLGYIPKAGVTRFSDPELEAMENAEFYGTISDFTGQGLRGPTDRIPTEEIPKELIDIQQDPKFFDTYPGAFAPMMIAGLNTYANIMEGDERRAEEERLSNTMYNPHNNFASREQDRGDYTKNQGFFQPDRYTRKGATNIAQRGYEVGEEDQLSEEEIRMLKKQGYQIEYLD